MEKIKKLSDEDDTFENNENVIEQFVEDTDEQILENSIQELNEEDDLDKELEKELNELKLEEEI